MVGLPNCFGLFRMGDPGRVPDVWGLVVRVTDVSSESGSCRVERCTVVGLGFVVGRVFLFR